MYSALLRISGLFVLMGTLGHSRAATPATAAAASAPATAAPAADASAKEKLTPEAEIASLERERAELVRAIRQSRSQASQAREKVIKSTPAMAAMQRRIEELEREIKKAREELDGWMKAAGLDVSGAPAPALASMERMREIDRRLQELMELRLQPKVGAAPADAPAAGTQEIQSAP
jgi:septal ring factor EnvC (AmiA/AmiB activator)